jgi:5-methylthioadenosine/S-adenosylhomocysteine deaminase
VHVSEADAVLASSAGAAWAHCPKSNAKLGNGIAPLGILQLARVGLGSDSVVSNNTMDLFEEMRFAVLQQRAATGRVDALTARGALEIATIGGAAALGLSDRVGSLERGKEADLIAVSLSGLHAAPCHDPYSALVYAARAADVRLTMVAGRELYRDGWFSEWDPAPARLRLEAAARKLRDAAV